MIPSLHDRKPCSQCRTVQRRTCLTDSSAITDSAYNASRKKALSLSTWTCYSKERKRLSRLDRNLVKVKQCFRHIVCTIIIIGRYGRKYRNTSWTVHQPAIRIKSVCHTIDRDRAIHYQMTITIIIITITVLISPACMHLSAVGEIIPVSANL